MDDMDALHRPSSLIIAAGLPRPPLAGSSLRLSSVLGAMSERFDVDLIALDAEPLNAEREAFVLDLGARSVTSLSGPFTLDSRFLRAESLAPGDERLAILQSLPIPKHMKFATPDTTEALAKTVGSNTPDIIHVFRSDLLLCARELADRMAVETGRRPFLVADLDDDETESLARLAEIVTIYSSKAFGREFTLSAELTRQVFERELRHFDVICICSERDRVRLQQTYPDVRVEVLSNTAPVLPSPTNPGKRASSDALRILFVGLLCYGPNIDAVELLVGGIVPEIRRRTDRKVLLDIVGREAGDDMIQRWTAAGAEVHNGPEDLTPFYERADIVAVPIRSAGGTRIKILEAFAHGVPVVSSPIGAEGLEVENGEHILIGDSIAEISEACIRLASDSILSASMARQARDLVERRYGPARVRSDLAQIYAPVLQIMS